LHDAQRFGVVNTANVLIAAMRTAFAGDAIWIGDATSCRYRQDTVGLQRRRNSRRPDHAWGATEARPRGRTTLGTMRWLA
jgi:hypothetical protein